MDLGFELQWRSVAHTGFRACPRFNYELYCARVRLQSVDMQQPSVSLHEAFNVLKLAAVQVTTRAMQLDCVPRLIHTALQYGGYLL